MAIPNRNEVPEELKWDLTRIFKNDEEWEQAYAAAQEKIDQLGELKGTLAKSGKDLYEGLTKILAVKREVENIYVYATMSSDVDTANSHYLGYVSRVQSLANQFEAATSFI
ncbi:MAG: oligoendopeptidase F, partial [Lactobacillus crispatus]|nr:oligoendopeptidase F [Lactobacillus crispatus]